MPPKRYQCAECRAPLVPVYVLYACRVLVGLYARKGKGKRTWTLDNEGKGKRTLNLQGEEQDHVGKGKRTLNLQGEEQDRMHHWRGSLEITAVASTPMPQAQSSEGNIARLEGGTEVLLRPKRRLRPLHSASKMPGRLALGLGPLVTEVGYTSGSGSSDSHDPAESPIGDTRHEFSTLKFINFLQG